MQGKWKVTSNPINGKTMYAVFRLADVLAVDHSGNREYASRDTSSVWTEDRKVAQTLANELNLIDFEELFIRGTNPTDLMNDMEVTFGIPAMYSQSFTEANPGVMRLYRRISDSRFSSET